MADDWAAKWGLPKADPSVGRWAVQMVSALAAMKVALLDLSLVERTAAAWVDLLGVPLAEM